jgi:thiol:disulfide interchange protein DsbG
MQSVQSKNRFSQIFSRNFLGLFLTTSLGLGLLGLGACTPQEPMKSETTKKQEKSVAPLTASAVPPVALTGEQKGELLIGNLTHHYVQVTDHFDAPGGLIGYVIQPVGKKRGSILYTDQAGEYLFSGNIVSATGENITQQETNTYVDSKVIGEMYQEIGQLNFFTQGKETAPHKLYIIFDPNCSICHIVFSMVQPMIDSGDLQVRWVPVGIMQASSVGKSAAILMGADDEARVALLKQDENNFDMKTESGGIPELKKPGAVSSSDSSLGQNKNKDKNKDKKDNGKTVTASANPDPSAVENAKIAAAFDLVAKNNQYFSDYGFNGTPVFLLQYSTGEKKFFPGFYQGSWLADEIKKTGDSWK